MTFFATSIKWTWFGVGYFHRPGLEIAYLHSHVVIEVNFEQHRKTANLKFPALVFSIDKHNSILEAEESQPVRQPVQRLRHRQERDDRLSGVPLGKASLMLTGISVDQIFMVRMAWKLLYELYSRTAKPKFPAQYKSNLSQGYDTQLSKLSTVENWLIWFVLDCWNSYYNTKNHQNGNWNWLWVGMNLFIDVRLQEFLVILYLLSSGSPEANIRFIFRIFDRKNKGVIRKGDLKRIVKVGGLCHWAVWSSWVDCWTF